MELYIISLYIYSSNTKSIVPVLIIMVIYITT